ncbi:hypothetical protein PIB30_017784 [Stylosanthes scabra]|uniref:Uncharacterized protein n=1 Tax=Stylosanthes scabra TaxID=79078 RepID=A0ABU6T829_9FABA|nr:hypothetical protein [Stylosanthes scabra]
MAWSWHPVMHSIQLFLLVSIVITVSCWWTWLRNTANAVSPPSRILWLISVFYMFLAIMVFLVQISTLKLLQIPHLIFSVSLRVIFQFTPSVCLATLMAATALEPPIVSCATASIAAAPAAAPIVFGTASLAARAITSYFLCIIIIALLPLVADYDTYHRTVRPIPEAVAYITLVGPLLDLSIAIYVIVTTVILAGASHKQIAAEQVTDSIEVIVVFAVLAFSTVIYSMYVVGKLPLPNQSPDSNEPEQSSSTQIGIDVVS